jgi:hypothetical protein
MKPEIKVKTVFSENVKKKKQQKKPQKKPTLQKYPKNRFSEFLPKVHPSAF